MVGLLLTESSFPTDDGGLQVLEETTRHTHLVHYVFSRVRGPVNDQRHQEYRLMLVGLFADTHDHLDNLRQSVAQFNRRGCELVIFAGDLVSTFAVPPLRKLNCPLLASFGDNEGNRVGIRGGMEIVGEIHDPPFGYRSTDGTRFLITHQLELLRRDYDGCDVVVYGHTHRPAIHHDIHGRLFVNPGEASGWTYNRPSIAWLDTQTMQAEIVWLSRRVQSPESRAESRE